MNVKYIFGALLTIPFLPIMYWQSKRIRSTVPKLPEATDPEGFVSKDSENVLQVITIGESTIAGVGVATHDEGFSGVFANEIASNLNTSVHWKVYAKSGYTARQVSDHIIPTIKEKHLDLIVIGLGANDAFTLNTPYHWKKNIRRLITQLRSLYPATPIAFTNMAPIKEFPAFTKLLKSTIGNLVEILGEELSVIIKDYENVYYSSDVITVPYWAKLLNTSDDPATFFSDGVHPSRLTYEAWAKDFASFILAKPEILDRLKKNRKVES